MVYFRHRILFIALTFGAFAAAVWLHNIAQGPFNPIRLSQGLWSLAYLLFLIAVGYVLDLPDPTRPFFAFTKGIVAAIIAMAMISIAQGLFTDQFLPRFVIVMMIPIFGMCSSAASFALRAHSLRQDGEHLLLLVNDLEEVTIRRELANRHDSRGALTCIVNSRNSPASTIVLGLSQETMNRFAPMATQYRTGNVRIRTISAFYEEIFEKSYLDGNDFQHLFFDIAEVHHATYQRVSRLIDFGFGLLLATLFCVALPLVWCGNLVANRGPLFFKQERVGREGKLVSIYKFRSMRPSANISEWTISRDPRITKFGHLLRKFHVDELPQAINILRGDLAIVGPRPEQVKYVEMLSQDLPAYSLRHSIRPGLTGWAQVNYPYGASVEDARRKLEYDIYYLRHQGIWLDFVILARTLRHVLHLKGR
jgi:lipopolysaccharide/colanic/teichoic acid biosynthesis glycosyltransferase